MQCQAEGNPMANLWTDDEINILRHKARTKSAREIAELINRSEGSVKTKAFNLGIRFRKPRNAKYCQKTCKEVRELHRYLRPYQIAKKQGSHTTPFIEFYIFE